MNQKGIAPLAIVVIVIVAAVCVGFSIYYLYNSGRYIDGWEIVTGAIDGVIYDNDPTIVENYKNENVLITFYMTYGYLRDVGNLSDGLVVTLGSTQHDWGPFQATVRGEKDYGKGYVERSGAWTGIPGLSDSQGIHWKLHVSVTATGRLEKGENACLYLWALENADNENSKKLQSSVKLLWDDHDDLTITISCLGDSFTTSFGTVRLFGQPWTMG
jgi:hypothetical protein